MTAKHPLELLLCLDAKKVITLADGPLCERLGLDPARVIGQKLESTQQLSTPLQAVVDAALQGEPRSEEATLDGLRVAIHGFAQRGTNGKIAGVVVTVAETANGTDRPLPVVDDAVLIIDAQGRVIEVGATGPALLQRPAAEIIDRTLPDVLPEGPAAHIIRSAQTALQRGYATHLNYTLEIAGRTRYFAGAVSPLPPDRAVFVVRDITDHATERALRRTEERYRQLFDSMADICFVIDREWRYVAANQAASRVTHLNQQAFIGKTVMEVIPESDLERIISPYRSAVESGQPRHFEAERPLLPDAIPGQFEMVVYPISDGIMCIAHDITARVRAEEALRQSEARYHTIFEESREAIFIAALDGQIVDFNQAAIDLFGLTRQEASATSVVDLYVNPQDRENFVRAVTEIGAIRDYPIRLRHKNGTEMDCQISAAIWRGPDGSIKGYQGHVRDITAQHRADEALRESEARFRAVFEGTTLGIAVLDLSGRPLMVNPALQSILEYDDNELRGLTLHELIHPQDLGRGWQRFTELAQGRRESYQVEERYVTRSGSAVWVNVTTSVVWDDQATPLYAIAIVEDIRERRSAEQALRESEERYRRLVELSPEPLAVHIAGKLVYLNAACVRILGAETADELMGRGVMDFVHPDYRGVVSERIKQVQESGEDAPLIQEKFVRLDGKVIDVEVVSIPITYHGQAGSQVIFRDITDRLRAEANERALAEALRKTSAALNSTLELPEVLHLILASVGQVVPHEAATIMLIDDEGAARVVEEHGYAERGFGDDVRALRFSVDYVQSLKQMFQSRQTIYVPNLEEFDGWLKMRHTEWIRSYVGAPISLGDQVIGFINLESSQVGYFSQAHAERLQTFADQAAIAIKNARLYDDLRRHAAELQDRNSDLDAFSHTVAHDLKAPLHVIMGYTSLILSDYKDQLNPEIMGHLDNVAQYADKLDTLIESMMLLAKLRSAEVQIAPVSPAPLVADAIERFRRLIEARHVHVDVAGALPPVMSYAPWLEEIFANLVENAIKYLGSRNPDPRITIRGNVQSDGMVRFQVEDNGIGISEENLKGLFKMFARIHSAEDVKGAGLGLSIVERIVHRLDGKVGVESTPGKGSIFWFALPGTPPDIPAAPSGVDL